MLRIQMFLTSSHLHGQFYCALLAMLVIIPPPIWSKSNNGAHDWVDLTQSFDNNTLHYFINAPFRIVISKGVAPGTGYWQQRESFSSGTHVGTHLDAPCHFSKGGWCITDIPLEQFIQDAVVVDISQEVGQNPDIHLLPRHLIEWEAKYGRIPNGCVLLIRTGWSRFWTDPKKYMGSLERVATKLRYPSVSPEAGRWLLSNRNVVGLGIDSLTMDGSHSDSANHNNFLQKSIYFLENLKNLEKLPPVGTTLYAFPMKISDASAAPVRVIASVPRI